MPYCAAWSAHPQFSFFLHPAPGLRTCPCRRAWSPQGSRAAELEPYVQSKCIELVTAIAARWGGEGPEAGGEGKLLRRGNAEAGRRWEMAGSGKGGKGGARWRDRGLPAAGLAYRSKVHASGMRVSRLARVSTCPASSRQAPQRVEPSGDLKAGAAARNSQC